MVPRNPTTGIAACCARAASGHAAAVAAAACLTGVTLAGVFERDLQIAKANADARNL
jgi:hypothetical protein